MINIINRSIGQNYFFESLYTVQCPLPQSGYIYYYIYPKNYVLVNHYWLIVTVSYQIYLLAYFFTLLPSYPIAPSTTTTPRTTTSTTTTTTTTTTARSTTTTTTTTTTQPPRSMLPDDIQVSVVVLSAQLLYLQGRPTRNP